MSFGSDTPGGSPEGIGGNESGIGSGGGGGGGGGGGFSAFSEEAMNAAMQQSVAQMHESIMESSLAADPGRDLGGVVSGMDSYTSDPSNQGMRDAVANENRERDFRGQNPMDMVQSYQAANAVGMPTDFMGRAIGQNIAAGLGNFVGGNLGLAAGSLLGPAGSLLGAAGSILGGYYGGKTGDKMVERAATNQVDEALGLVPNVLGPSTPKAGPAGLDDIDNLVTRLIRKEKGEGYGV